jgi:hypothetical protein
MASRLSLPRASSEKFGLEYRELVIDGSPLRGLLHHADPEDQELDSAGLGPVGENVSVLVQNWPAAGYHGAGGLLGEQVPELVDGRVLLFVCPACGDLGCGAVSAVVEFSDRTVVWRDFGWDTGWDDGEGEIRFAGGPFVFDRDQYEAELHEFISTYDAVRASLPPRIPPTPRRRRARWWPRSRSTSSIRTLPDGAAPVLASEDDVEHTRLDLDEVAGEIESRRASWTSQGVTVGELTWCDLDSRWPWRPTADRSAIGDPVSLGVVMSHGEAEVHVCIWQGGWADVEGIVGGEVLTEVPWFADAVSCIAAVESVATRVADAV